MDFSFATILADVLIFGTIGLFAFNGFRRGVLRSLFGFLRIYLSFIITTLLYERAALLLQAVFDMPSPPARMIGFTIIFAVFLAIIWVVISILAKLSRVPEPSGSLSKIGGIVLGLAEGILIVSIMIMDIGFYSPPEIQSPLEGTISYNTVKPIAPGIKDFTVGHISRIKEIPDALESRKETKN